MTEADTDRCIDGSCHCGNIRFVFHRPQGDGTIPVRICGCSFCRKHGGRWTSHPAGGFELKVGNASDVHLYRFGTHSADFHVCARCGVVPLVTCVLEGRRYGVVNANTFDGIDADALIAAHADFESEELETRLVRRRKNWTPESQR